MGDEVVHGPWRARRRRIPFARMKAVDQVEERRSLGVHDHPDVERIHTENLHELQLRAWTGGNRADL